jgi:ribose transport system substrate-binding protein
MGKSQTSTLLVLLAAALVAIVSASCDQPEGAHVKKFDRPRMLLLLNVNSNEFFRKIEEGFNQGMTADMKRNYVLDVRYCLKPSDVAYQRSILDRYIADYVTGEKDPTLKAVIMAPAGSSDEVTAQIKQLRDRDIPVVIVDMRIKPEALARAHTDLSAYIGSQNRAGGILAADQMAKCLPEGGAVLVLNGVPGREAAKDRRIGFTERLAEIAEQGQVPYKVTERTADFLRSQAKSTMDTLLSQGQLFDGIFAANDEMALGALEALRQKKVQNKVVVIGFDAIQEAMTAVDDGRMAATIAQDPVGMGQKAAQTVDKLLKHQAVQQEQILPPKVITHG